MATAMAGTKEKRRVGGEGISSSARRRSMEKEKIHQRDLHGPKGEEDEEEEVEKVKREEAEDEEKAAEDLKLKSAEKGL